MQGLKLPGSTGFAFWIGDESGPTVGASPAIPLFYCGFPEARPKWLLPGQEVLCGICNIPGTISTHSIGCLNDVGAGAASSSVIWGSTTAGTSNSDVPDLISLSWKQLAASPHPGFVNSSSFICFCWYLSIRCCTILEIVPITQPYSSSSLSLPCSVSSSSSSSPSSPSWELARLLRLSLIATIISWDGFLGSLVVNPAFSGVQVSSCSCWIAATAASTHFVVPAVSLPTSSTIYLSFSSLLGKCVSHRFPAATFFLDCNLFNALRARTLSASKPLLPAFARWWSCVDWFVDLPYLPAGSAEMFLFGAFSIVVCVDFVVGPDVGSCRIWTIWRQAASFMSRLVCLIILNKAKSAFWLSIQWEQLG